MSVDASKHDLASIGARWVSVHGDAMFAFAVRRLGDRNSAEDAVQEALLGALRNLSTFRGESEERTWLIGILRKKVIDLIRKRSRDREDADGLIEAGNPEFAEGSWKERPSRWDSLPDSALEQAELRKILDNAIDELPVAMRTAFCLREIDQVETQEICEIMAITPTNLWTLIHRAKLHLRQRLTLEWFSRESPQ